MLHGPPLLHLAGMPEQAEHAHVFACRCMFSSGDMDASSRRSHLPDAASQFCKLSSDGMIGTSASATILLHREQLLLEGTILLAQGISFSFPCAGCPLSPFGLIHAVLQSLLFKSVKEMMVPKPSELMVSRGVGRKLNHDRLCWPAGE